MRAAILCSLNLHSGGGFGSADFVLFFANHFKKANFVIYFYERFHLETLLACIRKAIWVNFFGVQLFYN
jgi:hypothetical protein